jgi:hypothetical protein
VTPEQRAALAALADVLVPAGEGMPSASDVGLQEKWIDRALRARPELEPELLRALEVSGEDPAAHLERLRANDRAGYETLVLLVTAAYYMHPKVRKAVGYPGQKPNPPYPDESDYYLRDGLLEPVIARGRLYRPTPS